VAGFDPFSLGEEQYTVPGVRRELSGNPVTLMRFRIAVENGKLKIRKPKRNLIDEAKLSAMFLGDASSLSKTDFHVLALALELKRQGFLPLIATDDYSIQNVADQMNMEFASLATFGIRFRLHWIKYCPACFKKYPANDNSGRCEVCGAKLKRKPYSKHLVER